MVEKVSQYIIITNNKALKTITATKPAKVRIPILMKHSKHINTRPLLKEANPRIFSEESRSGVIKCNQRYSS